MRRHARRSTSRRQRRPPPGRWQQTLDEMEAAELAAAAAALRATAVDAPAPRGGSSAAWHLDPRHARWDLDPRRARRWASAGAPSPGRARSRRAGHARLRPGTDPDTGPCRADRRRARGADRRRRRVSRAAVRDDRGQPQGRGARSRPGHDPRRPERDRSERRRPGRARRGRQPRCHRHRHVPRDRQAGRGEEGGRLGPVREPRPDVIEHDPLGQRRAHQRRRPLPHERGRDRSPC